MPNSLARILERLLCRVLPAAGRHRASVPVPSVAVADTPTLSLPRCVPAWADGAASEARRRRGEQRSRRRVLWLATHGVDVRPRRVHGMEVAR